MIAALLVAGCSRPVKDAEDRYAIVLRSGSAAEVCAEGRRLTEAYLQAKDADGYARRRVETSIDCQSRELGAADGRSR